jgi:hypothetical protein
MKDPVIVWLEEIRDFAGATDRAREMAQQAIDRLAPAAAPDQEHPQRVIATDTVTGVQRERVDTKIDRIVDAAREETERGRQERRK